MKLVSCKNYPKCSGRTLMKADVFLGEAKCRSCGLVAKYYSITPEGVEKIKLMIDNDVIDIESLGLEKRELATE